LPNDTPLMYGKSVIFSHPTWGIFQRNGLPLVGRTYYLM
jgi:hypothetical protein